MSGVVQLRTVLPPDLECFYQHQMDVEATRMAAFPSRQRGAFLDHWARILADPTNHSWFGAPRGWGRAFTHLLGGDGASEIRQRRWVRVRRRACW